MPFIISIDRTIISRGRLVEPRYRGVQRNCFDCHGADGTGYDPIGSTNLTRPDLYLWGSDRASIHESIVKGRRAVMPAFDGTLEPYEIKAVSIFVFSHAST